MLSEAEKVRPTASVTVGRDACMSLVGSEKTKLATLFHGRETRVENDRHCVDTGDARYYVFALFTLGGTRVARRLLDLKDRRLHAFECADVYRDPEHHIDERVGAASIREG
jgi:TnpA family transposase